MRLKDNFLIQTFDEMQYLVPIGAEAFNGIVRGNRTAAFIVDELKKDTTAEAIVDAVCRHFGAPRDVVAPDVEEILGVLRGIHALEEP